MTFAVYLMNTAGQQSSIKFGGFDTTALLDPNEELTLLKTVSTTSWALKFDRAMLGNRRFTTRLRKAVIDYAMPFIYLPKTDFTRASSNIQRWATQISNYPTSCSDGSCHFEKSCAEMRELDLKLDNELTFQIWLEDRDDEEKQR